MNLLILFVNSDPVVKAHYFFASGLPNDPIGFAGGEHLPVARSKGGAFLFLLTSMGTPVLPADFRSKTMGFPQNSGNSSNRAVSRPI